MILDRLIGPRIACFALCAMLFGALAPGLTQLRVRSAVAKTWVALCSTTGVKRIELAPDGKSAPLDHVAGKGHCPLCSLDTHSPLIAFASSGLASPPATARFIGIEVASTSAARALHWPIWHSRAPPMPA
jgi:hypothetical protein